MVESNFGPPRDPTFHYYSIYDPGQVPDQNHPNGANYGRVRDRTLFSLLDQAQHTLDEAKRRQLLAQFQRYLVDQVYWIGLDAHPILAWVKPTFGNYNTLGGPIEYFSWNAYQWYVR
jgi:ABC-type transport system substrate-binding protein